MSTVTFYDPNGHATAGNSMAIATDTVASLTAPTVAELNAGIAFECAIEEIGMSATHTTVTRRKICDTVAERKLGVAEYGDVTISFVLDDPQGSTQKLWAMFEPRKQVVIAQRWGLAHNTALASAQKLSSIFRARVATRVLDSVTTADGEEYTATVVLTEVDPEFFVAIAAGGGG